MNGLRRNILDELARILALDVWIYVAVFQVIIAILRGFSTSSSVRLSIIEGVVSATFWLAAAVLPLTTDVRKKNDLVLDALNAIAAGATGAAVMCATGSGWLIALGLVEPPRQATVVNFTCADFAELNRVRPEGATPCSRTFRSAMP